MPSRIREEDNINMDAEEVVDITMIDEEVKEGSVEEAKDEVTIPIHYLVHMAMELLFLKLRYTIKVNINDCPKISG